MSKAKFEIATVDGSSVTVDVSNLGKSDSMFFNATELAKPFGKRPSDFWKLEQNREYLAALVTLSEGNEKFFVKSVRGGKHQGTWLHNDLALQFARWISPAFAVRLDRWIRDRIKAERDWSAQRMEARTGFRPLTDAIMDAHDPAKFYHYSSEADLINRIVLGMTAKEYREKYQVTDVRDALTKDQLADIDHLQKVDVGLVAVGMPYKDRATNLRACHTKRRQRLIGREGAA